MLVLVVSLFLTFGAVELRRVWRDARSTVELERASRVLAAENARVADSVPRLLVPFHTPAVDAGADRARSAYAIRCSCDGRDS